MKPRSETGKAVMKVLGPPPDQDLDPAAHYEYTEEYSRECVRYRYAKNAGIEYVYPSPGRPENKQKKRKEAEFEPLPYPGMERKGYWVDAKDGHRCHSCYELREGYCSRVLVSYFVSGGRIVYWFCRRCGWKHEPGVTVPVEQNKPEVWLGRYDKADHSR